MFDKQSLFEARAEGYRICRIPGMIVSPGDVALAHCESRMGRGGDWDPIDIRMRRSLEAGSRGSLPVLSSTTLISAPRSTILF